MNSQFILQQIEKQFEDKDKIKIDKGKIDYRRDFAETLRNNGDVIPYINYFK